MNLTQEQIKHVLKTVHESRISIQTLHDDLVDHICCAVERKMDHDVPFTQALSEALQELDPEGLAQIENDTHELLNLKKIHMKRITYSVGLLSAMTMSFGWLLKILRLPIGNAVFAFGALAFVVLFLPLLGHTYIRSNRDRALSTKMKTITGIVSVTFVGLGVLARIMHIPGADEVLLAGGAIFTFAFLPFFFFALYRNSVTVNQR